MKQIIALVLVTVLVLSFVACNKDDATEKQTEKEKTTHTEEKVEENQEQEAQQGMKLFFDAGKYTAKKEDKDINSDNSYSITTRYTLDTKSSRDFSKEITIDSVIIVLGTTKVADLANTGLKWTSSTDDMKPNIIAFPYATTLNGNSVCFTVTNATDSTIKFSDGLVEGVSFGEDVNFSYDGLNSSSSPEDFVKTLGNPTGVYITDYYSANDEYIRSSIYVHYTYDNFNSNFAFNYDGTEFRITDVSFE